jgi:SAM-dependent methyltransferase
MNISKDYQLTYPWLPTVETKDVVCCLCNGKNKTKDVFEFSINDNIFSIRHCIHDNILFLYPQPAGGYTDALYNHPSYFIGEDDMYGLAVSDEKSKTVAGFRIQEIKDYFKKENREIAHLSMLEIGCAYGHTLVEARIAGMTTTDGVEFSKEATEICNSKEGLNVILGSVNDAFENLLPKNQYDVIAMYSVLEHVNNPLEFLTRVIPLLSPTGIMVIRVPEMSGEGPWLSLVDHFWHFTRESLTTILDITGLTEIKIFPSGKFVGTQHPGTLQSITAIASKSS